MIDALLEKLEIPEACSLDKPVFKKMFLEHAELDATDRKTLSEDVDRIRWRFTLKPETINIRPYLDEIRDYPEIAILSVELSSPDRARRIASFMHRAIPYPLILIFEHKGQVCLSVADKRINQADKSKLVLLDRWQTEWFDPSQPNTSHAAFMAALTLSRLPTTNFYALYESFQAQIIQLVAAGRTGQFKPVPINESRKHADALKQIDGLEREIAELKSKLKRERQMGRKIALNSQIRQRKNAILNLEASLRLNG